MFDQKRDLELLFKKYNEMAGNGNARAMMFVADCFLYGWGTDPDYAKYKSFLNMAAEYGVDFAYEKLFYEALSGNDYQEVERISQRWISKKKIDFYVSKCEKTLEIYKSLDEKSVNKMIEAFSQTKFPTDWDKTIAMIYQFGFGVERNPIKAAEILSNSDDRLDSYSSATILGMFDMGLIHESQINRKLIDSVGEVTYLDTYELDGHNRFLGYNERVIIFAACIGNYKSMIQLGRTYESDDIRNDSSNPNKYPSDFDAARWFINALENGADPLECIELVFLADKLCEKTAYKIAFKAYCSLAQKEFVPAIYALGNYFWNGWGTEKDYEAAAQSWLIAAKCGYEDAVSLVNKIINIGNGNYNAGINAMIQHDL